MNSADVLTAILHARENGDDPLLILAEDSPLMDAAREALKPKAPYQSHALDEAVSKFLCWRLPRDFHPDGGISLTYPPESADGHWWPTGTNLFTAEQARNMLEHVVGERIAEQDATIAALREQLAGWQRNAAFYRSCAMGGEIPTEPPYIDPPEEPKAYSATLPEDNFVTGEGFIDEHEPAQEPPHA